MQRGYRICLIISVLLSACAANPGRNYYSHQQYPVAGVLLGGAGGAMIGYAIDEEHGVYLGAITGSVVGGVTDYYINKDRQRENRRHSYRGQRNSGAYHRKGHKRLLAFMFCSALIFGFIFKCFGFVKLESKLCHRIVNRNHL